MNPPRPRRSVWGWIRSGVLWGSLVFLGLSVGVITGLLFTDWGRSWSRVMLVDVVNAQLRGTLEVDHLVGDPFGELVLEGIRLRNPGGDAPVAIERVEVVADWYALMTGEIIVDHISVEGLSARIFNADGSLSFAEALPPTKKKEDKEDEDKTPGLDWTLRSIRLQIDRVEWGGGSPLAVGPGVLTAEMGSYGGRLEWSVASPGLRIEGISPRGPRDVGLACVGGVTESIVSIDELAIQTPLSSLGIRGRFDPSRQTAKVDVESFDIVLAEWLSRSPVTGHLAGRLRASWAEDAVTASGQIVSDGGTVDVDASLRDITRDLSGSVSLKAPRLDVDRLLTDVSTDLAIAIDVSLTGQGLPLQPDSKWSVDVTARDFVSELPTPLRISVGADTTGRRATASLNFDGPGRAFGDLQATAGDVLNGPYSATMAAGGLSTTVLERWMGDLGVQGRLGAVEATAIAQRYESGMRVEANVSSTLRRVDASKFSGAAAKKIVFDAAVVLDPLPTVEKGRLSAQLTEARGAGFEAESLGVDLTVRGIGTDGGLKVEGPVRTTGLRQGGQLAVRKANLALKADLSPEGAADVRVDGNIWGVRASTIRAGEVRLGLDGKYRPGLLPLFGVSGTIGTSDLRTPGPVSAAELEATVDAQFAAARLNAEVSLAGDSVDVAGHLFNRLNFDGKLERSKELVFALSSTSSARTIDLAGLVEIPGRKRPGVRGKMSRVYWKEGSLGFEMEPGLSFAWDPSGRAEVHQLDLRGVGLPGRLQADGQVDPPREMLRGTASLTGFDIVAWGDALSSWTNGAVGLPEGVGGVLEGFANIDGSLQKPRGEVDVAFTRGGIGPIESAEGRVRCEIQPGRLTVDGDVDWNDDAGMAHLDANLPVTVSLSPVSVQWPADEPFSVDVSAKPLELSWLQALAPDGIGDVSGTAEFSLKGQGTRADPKGDFSLDLVEPRIGAWKPRKVFAKAKLNEKSVRLDARIRDTKKSGLAVRARLPPTPVKALMNGEDPEWLAAFEVKDVVVEVAADEFELARLKTAWAMLAEPPPLQGTLHGSLKATGGPSKAVLSGRMVGRNFDWQGRGMSVSLLAEPETDDLGGHSRVTLDLGVENRHVGEASLRIPEAMVSTMVNSSPFEVIVDPGLQLQLETAGIDRQLVALFDTGIARTLGGLVQNYRGWMNVDLAGSPDGPLLYANAGLRQVARDPGSAPGAFRDVEMRFQVGLEETGLTVVAGQSGNGGYLSATADLEWGSGWIVNGGWEDPLEAPLQARVQTESFSVPALSTGLPDIFGGTAGDLSLLVEATGTLAEPEVEGKLLGHFEPLVIPVAGFKAPQADVELQLRPDEIVLLPVEIVSGERKMSISARVDTTEWDPKEMTLGGGILIDSYRIVDREDAEVIASGNLKLSGTVAEPSMAGQIEIERGELLPSLGSRSTQPIGLPADVVFVDSPPPRLAAAGARSRGQPKLPLDLNIELVVPERALHVKSSLFDLFAEGNLAIQTRDRRLAIQGRVAVDEGSVSLYGRRFVVRPDSQVIFDGGTELDPSLAISAQYDISGIDLTSLGIATGEEAYVLVTVGGTATKPTLDLTSDPVMDETNIVSIIVTGVPVSAGGDSADQLEAQTVNLFTGLATGTLSTLVEGQLPIDVFQVETGSQSLSQAKVRVGKRINQDLLVLYVANVGADEDENANEVIVEYRLIRSLLLRTRVGDVGEGGVSLVWAWSR